MLVWLLSLAPLAIPQGDAETMTPADSARVRRDAADAQARFERTRRQLLPVTTAGTGRCDERVGRYCYWYDPTEPPPSPEPEDIKALRRALLARLDAAADALPGDEWILAQRVRYRVEHGTPDSAAALAAGCNTWWCAALEGYAWHNAGKVRAAEHAFARALSRMPEAVRCEWNNLRPLLEGADRDGYQGLGCGARDSANAALFFRSIPLVGRGGNDTRTEWFARHTFLRTLDGAITHHGGRLGPDLGEMILRYGWATGYGRKPDRHGLIQGSDVIGHEPKPAYPFLAPAEGGEWPPGAGRPRARFAPVFAREMHSLGDVQLARFHRGDSVVLAAAFTARNDSAFTRAETSALLALAGPGRAPELSRTAAPFGRGRAWLTSRSRGGMVSLEVGDSAARTWAVFRAILPDTATDMSDLLITRPADRLPATLDEAVALAWPGNRIGEDAAVGLFWESYGHAAADTTLEVSLAIEPVRPGLVGRLGQALGLRRKLTPLRLTWTRGRDPGVTITAHAVEVDLSELSRGLYDVVVDLGAGRRVARRFEIVARFDPEVEPEGPDQR